MRYNGENYIAGRVEDYERFRNNQKEKYRGEEENPEYYCERKNERNNKMNNEKEISLINKQEETIPEMTIGKIFAESGMFADIKNAAQGYVKVMAGKELGLSPIQSLTAFYFVNGKLGIVSNTMAALVKKSGKYDYEIVIHTNEECVIDFFKINGEKKKIGTSKFDIKAAAKAGIVNKDVWKNYTMNMLFARAITNGIRWYCPDAVSAFIYSVEELHDLEPEKKIETITMSQEGEVSSGNVKKDSVE
jgi:hypothetical protein